MILLDLINIIDKNTNVCLWNDNSEIIEEFHGVEEIPDEYINIPIIEITAGYFKIDIICKGVIV